MNKQSLNITSARKNRHLDKQLSDIPEYNSFYLIVLPEYFLLCGYYCRDELSGTSELYGQHSTAKPVRISVSIQATSNRHSTIIYNF